MRIIQAVKFVLHQTYQACGNIFILYLFTQFIIASASIVNIFIFKEIINSINNQPTTFKLSLTTIVVIRLVYEVVSKITEKYGEYLWNEIDIRQTIYGNKKFVEKLSTLDIATFDNPQSHDLMWRAFNRFQWHIRYYLGTFINFFRKIIEFSISVLIFTLASPLGALLIVGSNIIPIIINSKVGNFTFNIYKADSETKRKFEYAQNLVTTRESLIEIKGFQAFPFIKQRIIDLHQKFITKQQQHFNRSIIKITLGELLPIFAVFLYLLILIQQFQRGEINTGNFVFLFTNIFVFSSALQQLSIHMGSLASDHHFIHDAIDFFALKPLISFPHVSKEKQQNIQQLLQKPTIELKNVSFTYPNSPKPVLQNVSLTIPFGQNIALIGENGAGKSTLVKLLLRVYDPTEGSIYVNGVNIKEIPEIIFYQMYSTLFQSFGKFYLSIRENMDIAAGKKLKDEDYINTLKLSNAWNFVKDFPKQLDQQLGPTYTDGVDLSGGQWQQLAIAKALIKNTPILVLDEPTSAVDAKAETEIFDRLNRETHDKTVIFISHRFSTIKDAERIVVMDKGRIIEDGTHGQLLVNNKKYAQLYTSQAARYERNTG